MTTVAFDGRNVAADSMSTVGGIMAGYHGKLFAHRGVIATGTGDAALCKRFRDWVQAGMRGEPPPMKMGENEAQCMLFYAPNRYIDFDEAGPIPLEAPFVAYGSGREIALGALAAGASAARAVEIAASLCPYTGGEITTFAVRDA